MLFVDQVSVSLANTTILDRLEFLALPGEITAVIGPNGSGKSTLMRAISGDIQYKGKILLNGYDIDTLQRCELAYMRAVLPQKSVLAFSFNVSEVVHIGLRNSVGAEANKTINEALRCVGLLGFAQRQYSELSGGEQQRVQLARVLAQVWIPYENGQPRWIFLDEPVSSLDVAYQIEVMNIAKNYARSGGGVIAVMHDLNLTSMYADNIAVLFCGKKLCQGVPGDVMTDEWLSRAYECNLRVNITPQAPATYILPHVAVAKPKSKL